LFTTFLSFPVFVAWQGLYRKGRSHIHRPSVKAYTISALSPWHRPLLVFINTKSGPQVTTPFLFSC
jgi:hypothetical protein